jgi:N5-(cytidine 5'-diphosphoramidyl)-L-glutamine hydrolase
VVQAGFLPVAIPNILTCSDSSKEATLEIWIQAMQPNALILSGGNDIGEYQMRDASEHHLLSWAERENIPVLGICRGMQMMAVWANGELVNKEGHVRSRHELDVVSEKNEWPTNVNSYHNMVLSSCPNGFEVAAMSEDNSIEAIEHINLPWEGWMWHPEREATFSSIDIRRFQKLLNYEK